MKLGQRRYLALGVVAIAMAGTVGLTPNAIAAPTTSPFDPPIEQTATNGSGATQGTLSFFDATGTKITTGPVSTPPAFIKADSDSGRAGDTLATAFAATPIKGANAATWGSQQISAADAYPRATAPFAGAAQAVVSSTFNWMGAAQYPADVPNINTDAAWQDLYQIRVYTSGSGQAPDSARYASATLSVDTGAGTWTQIYPMAAEPTATTTTLAISPVGKQFAGQNVTLTSSTVSAAAGGSVQFMDGDEALGAPVAVNAGQASISTSALSLGQHALRAVFTPTDAAEFVASSSAVTTYSIVGAPSWKPVLDGPHRVGMVDRCLASFSDATSVSYAWFFNGVQASSTAASLTLGETAINKTVSCRVTATNPAGTSTSTSTGYKVGVGPALRVVTRPTIAGLHRAGQVETVRVGSWSPAATSYLYQWYVGTTKITGATGQSYRVAASLRGKTINCVVTARRAAWTNGVYRTAAVRIV